MSHNCALRAALGCALSTIAIATAFAQTAIHGSLRGVVLDAQGLGVPGSRVVLTNSATGGQWTTSSGSSGEYQFARLTPGRYRLTAEKNGFRQTLRDSIELAVNETTIADMMLSVGETTESVQVTGDAEIV